MPISSTVAARRIIIAIFGAEWLTAVIIQAIAFQNVLLLKVYANRRDIYRL